MNGTEDAAASASNDPGTSVPAPDSPESGQAETTTSEAEQPTEPGTAEPDEAAPEEADPDDADPDDAAQEEAEPDDAPQEEAESDDAAAQPAEAGEAPPEAEELEPAELEPAELEPEELEPEELEPEELEPAELEAEAADLPVPSVGPGLHGWVQGAGAVLWGAAAPLALIVGLAALATYHLIVRAGDVLVTLVGGFGPVMLPLWVLAFIVLSPVPLMICLAGTVGVVSARASAETRPAVVWRSIAARLGTLWLWLAGCYVVMLTPSLLFSLSGVMLDRATDLAMTVALDLIWTVALTVAGMVGCVVLVEPGQSLPRAWRLLSPIPVIGLAAATLALVVLPELANMTWGAVGLTVTSACCDLLWAVAALVTYAQARGRIEPVAGPAPHDEPATPEAVPVD